MKTCSVCGTTDQSAFSAKNHRCRACQYVINRAKNPERNYISQRAYNLAGYSGLNFYALPRPERLKWRHLAKQLIDLGSSFGVAEKAEKRRTDGVLYVVSHPNMDGVKIGRAFDAKSRLANYQTGCPERSYTLEYASPYFTDVVEAEQQIHDFFVNQRLKGEWFAVSAVAAAWQINKTAVGQLRAA